MRSSPFAAGAFVVALRLAPLLAAQPVAQPDTLLARLTAEALAANPGLVRLDARARAAAARIRPAGALPDPMLSVGLTDLELPRFAFTQSDFTEVDLEARQEFPWPGTLAARSRAAKASAAARRADVSTRRRDVVVRTAALYNRLRYLIAAREILRRQHALLASSVEIATARYATGSAPQSDPLDARAARAQLNGEAASLAAGEVRLRAELRAWRGIVTAESLAVSPIEPSEVRALYPTLESHPHGDIRSLDQHPLLAARQAAVSAAEETARAEGLGARPDFAVMARYGARTIASDFFSASVGLRVPLWAGRKQKPLAEAARQEAGAERAALAEDRAMLESEYRATLAEAEAGLERLRLLLDEVLPSAEAARDAALRSYQVGKVDFQAVLSAEERVYRAQLETAEVATEHLSHLVMLQQLTAQEGTP